MVCLRPFPSDISNITASPCEMAPRIFQKQSCNPEKSVRQPGSQLCQAGPLNELALREFQRIFEPSEATSGRDSCLMGTFIRLILQGRYDILDQVDGIQ